MNLEQRKPKSPLKICLLITFFPLFTLTEAPVLLLKLSPKGRPQGSRPTEHRFIVGEGLVPSLFFTEFIADQILGTSNYLPRGAPCLI